MVISSLHSDCSATLDIGLEETRPVLVSGRNRARRSAARRGATARRGAAA